METSENINESISSLIDKNVSPKFETINMSNLNNDNISNIYTNTKPNYTKYFIIFLIILAFLGYNILDYLAKGSNFLIDIFRPLLNLLGITVGDTTKQTIMVSTEGTKQLIDTTSNTLVGGIDLLQHSIDNKKIQNNIDKKKPQNKVNNNQQIEVKEPPIPDNGLSKTQLNNPTNKSGYCYIGEDRGFRSCIKVGEADNCVSQQIFPSQAICINPNLRH
jgi:hypothetical protein